jgi:hypothetical protein
MWSVQVYNEGIAHNALPLERLKQRAADFQIRYVSWMKKKVAQQVLIHPQSHRCLWRLSCCVFAAFITV